MTQTAVSESAPGVREHQFMYHMVSLTIFTARYAMTALIQVYSLQNEIGCQRADPIFVRLYQCFEVAKNPIRETLLVAVGAMGKSVISSFRN